MQNQNQPGSGRKRRTDRMAGMYEQWDAEDSAVYGVQPDDTEPAAQIPAWFAGKAEATAQTPPAKAVHRQPGQARQPQRTQQPQRDRQPQRAWQKEQPSDWTDQIRVVHYADDEQPEEPEVHRTVEQLAVDRVIRLAATLAAMFSPFALFLLFEERKSRALRHYSAQSVALSAINLAVGGLAALMIWITGAIPVLGYVIKLACLLVYCGSAVALLLLRVRLMSFAWGGYRWDVPILGEWLQRFVNK